MKLIVNADDFGYTLGVTYGIIEAYKNGIVRSTTVLCNSNHMSLLKVLSEKNENLGIGVHLNCTLGKSLTKNSTLTDQEGNFFPGKKEIWTKNISYDELYMEWKCQIERFIEIFQKKPTHLDSHHSVHDANEKALKVSMRLAQEYSLPLRRYSVFKFISDIYKKEINVENFITLLKKHKNENIEMMCHPGFCDLELYRGSSYSLDRVRELDVLSDKELVNFVLENKIALLHY